MNTSSLSHEWRILLAGALIAAASGLIVAIIGQWRFEAQLTYMEKQHDKRIAAIKSQHTKEMNQLKREAIQTENILKKIEELKETKGKP